MNRNHARRCLTGIQTLYATQVWTGSVYWVVRSRIWNASALPVPKRIEIDTERLTKTKLAGIVNDAVGHPMPARRMPGKWGQTRYPNGPSIAAIAPLMGWDVRPREWQAIGVDESWFVGLDELCHPSTLKVDLHQMSVSWWRSDEVLAVLRAVIGQPTRKEQTA